MIARSLRAPTLRLSRRGLAFPATSGSLSLSTPWFFMWGWNRPPGTAPNLPSYLSMIPKTGTHFSGSCSQAFGPISATQILPPPRAIPGGSLSLKALLKPSAGDFGHIPPGWTLNLGHTRNIRQAVASKSESNAKSCVPPVNSGENLAPDKASIRSLLEIRQADLSPACRKFRGCRD
jgi:hypothetical protein